MAFREAFRGIVRRRDESVRPKIASTIREIELHRKELENLRAKLETRRKVLFDTTVRAMQSKDRSKATVYANEWAEVRKVGRVVYASELALTQVTLRLESIVDVGDVMAHMSMAFKVLRRVNRTVQGLVPSLDQASSEISSTLTETMAEMGNVSPTISLNIQTESGEELVRQARRLAEQRADEMKQSLGVPDVSLDAITDDVERRVALLASGEDEGEAVSPLGVLYAPAEDPQAESQVLQYASIHNGNVDISDASSVLKIPSDDVEQAMLRLISEGKLKVAGQEGV